MSFWGGSNQGLRAQVSNPGGGRWLLIVFGVVAFILVATWVLAPYLPSSPKQVKDKQEPPVMTQASKAVLDGAEWTYKAVMPPTTPGLNSAPPSPQPTPAPAAQTPAAPPPKTYQTTPATPQLSVQERRRLADEEERRQKAKQREHEEEIKRWKPIPLGQKESKAEAPGQLIKASAYSLSPGELIPCETEPVLSNETPGAFRAFVTSHVYDSKSHRHVIIPQGTEMNLQVGGKTTIFGDTRLPIEAMTLKYPDGDWMKIGKVSAGDRYGTPGFTGDIDRHIWRIIGSIFFNSVLRGGTTALVANSYDQGVTDRMSSAAVAETAREGQNLSRQALRTDPTITVPSVFGCNILLQEPLVRPKPYQLVSAPGR